MSLSMTMQHLVFAYPAEALSNTGCFTDMDDLLFFFVRLAFVFFVLIFVWMVGGMWTEC